MGCSIKKHLNVAYKDCRYMNEDLQMFYDAFLVKNQIFPPESITTEKPTNKINPNDLRLAFMVEGLEKHERYKQITTQNG